MLGGGDLLLWDVNGSLYDMLRALYDMVGLFAGSGSRDHIRHQDGHRGSIAAERCLLLLGRMLLPRIIAASRMIQSACCF